MKKNRTYHQRNKLVDGFKVREHPLYTTWRNMLSRCYNKNDNGAENYGQRGITVCKEWEHFENFARDMFDTYEKGLTLDRINNDLGYSPENCAWRTNSDQCVNRRLFKNNTSGCTGVIAKGNGWVARFDYEKVRHIIGHFKNKEDAIEARNNFVEKFFVNKDAAVGALPKDKARWTSSTGVRGITPHVDGGFTVRLNVNKKRVYLGYFKTLEEAINERARFLKE